MAKFDQLSNWVVVPYDENVFVEAIYDKIDIEKVEIKIRRLLMKNMASFHMLK